MRSSPVIAVANPLWNGHHPTWFAQVTVSLLKAGACVLGLTSEPAAAAADAFAAASLAGIEDPRSRFSMHLLPRGKRSWFGGRFEGDPWRTHGRWQRAATALDEAEAATGWKADLVYFPYLDSYLRFLPCPGVPGNTINRPWSGLYLRNHHHAPGGGPLKALRLLAKGDALIRSPLCRGIGVLDERFNEALAGYTGKAITSYPDSAPLDLPAQPTALARQILEEAAGRKIIGLIGLEKRKGMLTLLRVALQADRLGLPWYFVCAGVYGRHLFTPGDQEFISGVAATLRGKNLHFNPDAGRIPDEADFNSVFSTFDIAWTAYEGFQGSSGALTKAAGFGIPALATTGECIGARVERHRIGLTIPEADCDKATEAIRRILSGTGWDDRPLAPDYDAYRSAHDISRLDAILAEMVAKA